VRAFHRTAHAVAILRDGFRDTTATYLTAREWTGVCLSDMPLDSNEGAEGDDLLAVEIPEDVFADHEWMEEGMGYREALIPAELVNRYPVEVVGEDEEDAITEERWRQRAREAGIPDAQTEARGREPR
jgi:hypothetical protein